MTTYVLIPNPIIITLFLVAILAFFIHDGREKRKEIG